MASWYKSGYLSSDLLVSSSHDGEFYSLSAIMQGVSDPDDAFREALDISNITALRSELLSLV